jgi:hypothetical protein
MKFYLRLSASAVLATGLLTADVTYTQATKYEGGTLIEMMHQGQ